MSLAANKVGVNSVKQEEWRELQAVGIELGSAPVDYSRWQRHRHQSHAHGFNTNAVNAGRREQKIAPVSETEFIGMVKYCAFNCEFSGEINSCDTQ